MVKISQQNRRLSRLKPGLMGMVEAFKNEQVGSRLMAMGVLPGSRIAVVRQAPFGGGCYVKVDDFYLALRKKEAACVLVNHAAD
ncbi:MAG TPA: FeoA family protein [Saprospiraceae bacterium]|nr:FeoA family protein [Saprospiraceae bacterium]HMQ82625.1 FeoA family protein [Saprospiraceae bacterium]